MKRIGLSGIIISLTLCCNMSLGSGPVVFRVSDPVGPDETALLFGEWMETGVRAEGWVLPDEPVSGPFGEAAWFSSRGGERLDVLQASDLCVKVLVPELAAGGICNPVARFVGRLLTGLFESDRALVVAGRIWPHGRAWRYDPRVRQESGRETHAWLVGEGKSIALTRVECESRARGCMMPSLRFPRRWLAANISCGFTTGTAARSVSVVPCRCVWHSPIMAVDSIRRWRSRRWVTAWPTIRPHFQPRWPRPRSRAAAWFTCPAAATKSIAKPGSLPRPCSAAKMRLVWLVVPEDLPEIETVLAGNGDFAVEYLSIVSQTARRLVVCPDYPSAYSMPWGRVPSDHLGHRICDGSGCTISAMHIDCRARTTSAARGGGTKHRPAGRPRHGTDGLRGDQLRECRWS